LRLEKLLSAAFQLLELGGRAIIICFKASEAIEGKGWMGFC
jgi:16S rRNA C1402 N4-methylase RsmH